MSQNSLLTLKIFSPEGIILEKSELNSINISLADNRPIGIRPGHAPLIAETKKGPVTLRSSGDVEDIQLRAGVLEIRNNMVTILTTGLASQTEAEFDSEINREYDRLMHSLINQIAPE